MPQFFIDRPVFAWVLAIFIMMAGALAIPQLPVAQYPDVAPPQVRIGANYTGAPPEEIYQSVTRLIEDELNGAPGLLYFESTSEATGRIAITATFEPGTDVGEATVEVQNRVRRVEPRLPLSVVQRGIRIEQARTGFLLMISLRSPDGSYDASALGDFLNRNVVSEIRRVPGVGSAQVFSSPRAMRVWMDPDRMVGLNITAEDIVAALRMQNAQVAAGRIGAEPTMDGQQITASVLVRGLLRSAEEFGDVVLRANPDGSRVYLRDVARLEIGSENYEFASRLDGQPSASIGVQLSPTANAMGTSSAIRAKMEEMAQFFPAGVEYSIPYDTSPFVRISIEKVLHTLVEAMVLVFLVMFLFLQNLRYTLIPSLVVPIALFGTAAVMLVAGFSINVLTMFAMVLAIGILVDDAIVVVENVERIMAEEGLSPRDATRKAMKQITGAIVGITLVLTAVFVPMAFFPGAVGVIYQQFSLTMVVSILFSGFLALSLTPALCASFLKPVSKGAHLERRGAFGWFNRGFHRMSSGYAGLIGKLARRAGRLMVVYAAILVGLGWMFVNLPSSFLPNEDQGFVLIDIQAPAEASARRTGAAIEQMEAILQSEPAVDRVVALRGFSFSGSGQNAGLSFVTLEDWSERGPEEAAAPLAQRLIGKFSAIADARMFALSPPPIAGLGTSSGFEFRLQDRLGLGYSALSAARDQLFGAAANSPVLTGLRVAGMPDAAQVSVSVDREKANAFGVHFSQIGATLSAHLGSQYVNDFPNQGRMQQVTVQADGVARMQAEDLLKLHVRNSAGGMVPLSAFASVEWIKGPTQIAGYNGYPALRISGQAAPGHSSGEAIAEMERLAGMLPPGFGFEWTGQSLQEIQSGAQAPMLIGISILFVFLLLAALYESWSIPLSVMLVVPLGIIGSVIAVMLRDLPNDVYFKVGLIAIIGLSAKNAILIVEFARDLHAEGKPLHQAAVEAARMRFRPILMTSLAFTLGVLPLALASGASAASQNAIGTGVLGGMISATVLAVFFVPAFFIFVMDPRGRKRRRADTEPERTEAVRLR